MLNSEIFNKAVECFKDKLGQLKSNRQIQTDREKKDLTFELIKNWEFFDKHVNCYDLDSNGLNKKIEIILPKFIDFKKKIKFIDDVSKTNKEIRSLADSNPKSVLRTIDLDKVDRSSNDLISNRMTQKNILQKKIECNDLLSSRLIKSNNCSIYDNSYNISLIETLKKYPNAMEKDKIRYKSKLNLKTWIKNLKSNKLKLVKENISSLNDQKFIDSIGNKNKISNLLKTNILNKKKCITQSKPPPNDFKPNNPINFAEMIPKIYKAESVRSRKVEMNIFNILGNRNELKSSCDSKIKKLTFNTSIKSNLKSL